MSKARLELFVGAWYMFKHIMAFGNPTAGGFKSMQEVLYQIQKLNKYLDEAYGITFAVSAHLWHEVAVSPDEPAIGCSAKWNNSRSITIEEWMDGVRAGYYPKIGRIVAPGFGLPGSDEGAFINPDPERRLLAHNMLVYSFKLSELVKAEGLGPGGSIYWTGPDGLRWQRLVDGQDILLGHSLNQEFEEWKLIVTGVGNALKDAIEKGYINTDLNFESKSGGDPCYLDAMTDTVLEIEAIKQINTIAGRDVVKWQGEVCHTRGGGQKFADAMRQVIDAKVFDGCIHLNSGALASKSFTKMLSRPGGTLMSQFQQYVDPDFLPGQGVKEWVQDQVNTIKIIKKWSAENNRPARVEFDARFAREEDAIEALKRSAEWTINEFNKAA